MQASSEASPLLRRVRQVAFYEVDAAGTLFGGRLFEFFVDMLFELLAKGGVVVRPPNATHLGPLIHMEADFQVPLRFGETYAAEIANVVLGRSSFTVNYRLIDPDNPLKVFATGKTVHVCIDGKTYEKSPLPESWRRALSGAADEQRGS
jgi:acyl-CoA thioesterase FadM